MSSYYYLLSGLPEIKVSDTKAKYDLSFITGNIIESLVGKDEKYFNYLVYQEDNKNLIRVLARQKGLFCPYTSHIVPSIFSEEILEKPELISNLPNYMAKFIEESKSLEWDNVRHMENYLLGLYYEEMINSKCGFIKKYATYMRDLKNVLVALNARALGFTGEAIQKELIGDYPLIAALTKSSANDFGVGRDIPYIITFVDAFNTDEIIDLSDIERIEFSLVSDFLDKEVSTKTFTTENLFSYYILLCYAFKFSSRNEEEGKAYIDTLTNSLREEIIIS